MWSSFGSGAAILLPPVDVVSHSDYVDVRMAGDHNLCVGNF